MGGKGSGPKPTKFQPQVGGKVREPVMINDDGRYAWELINAHCGDWLGELDSMVVQGAVESYENYRIACRQHGEVINSEGAINTDDLDAWAGRVKTYELSWFKYVRQLGLSPVTRKDLPASGKDAHAGSAMGNLLSKGGG